MVPTTAALVSLLCALTVATLPASCPDYTTYSENKHAPLSKGQYRLSAMRPSPECRTFNATRVDSTIDRLKSVIKDPDLYQLFENSFPNTLDTTIAWKGYSASNKDEELTFVITGDINAMWYRDSANQLQSYVSLLVPDKNAHSLASIYRGAINLQSRYLLAFPYCQSFQPPVESGIAPTVNGAGSDDTVTPPYSNTTVFECKWELDSYAAFLELSHNYWTATNDSAFFSKYNWVAAVKTILGVAKAEMISTYAANGSVLTPPYTFTRLTSTAADTLDNSGTGNPVNSGTGLIRSAFRPSDDATIYQLFIPANMMFSRYLLATAPIASAIGEKALARQMTSLGNSLRAAIEKYGIVQSTKYGSIYAYEIDGYESRNLMDDANIPSLLSAPVFGYLNMTDSVYQNTRKKMLSADNPYYMQGPVINAVGGPHDGQILTTDDDQEIYTSLKELVSSTDGLGLIHESINTFNQSDWTRQWFAWANGLFGQMILDLEARKPQILGMSFQ